MKLSVVARGMQRSKMYLMWGVGSARCAVGLVALSALVAPASCIDVGPASEEPGAGAGGSGSSASGGSGGGSPDAGGNDGSQCWPGEKWCGVCVGATDPSHGCGGPGCEPCVLPNATAGCTSEKCSVQACHPGFSDCNQTATDGCETSTQTSHENCGACAIPCAAAEVCYAGKCSSTCGALTNCSGSCVDTSSDEQHCGDCTTKCALQESCIGGKCSCAGGTTSCGGSCVDTKTNKQHCGLCNKPCTDPANGTAVCNNGTCAHICNTGFTPCGSQCVNAAADPNHCGGCNKPCETNCAGAACPCKASQCSGVSGTWLATSMKCGGVEFLSTTATYYDSPNGQYKVVNKDADCEQVDTGTWSTAPPNNYSYKSTMRTCAPVGCALGPANSPCVTGSINDSFSGKYSMTADGSQLTMTATGVCAGGAEYVGVFTRQ